MSQATYMEEVERVARGRLLALKWTAGLGAGTLLLRGGGTLSAEEPRVCLDVVLEAPQVDIVFPPGVERLLPTRRDGLHFWDPHLFEFQLPPTFVSLTRPEFDSSGQLIDSPANHEKASRDEGRPVDITTTPPAAPAPQHDTNAISRNSQIGNVKTLASLPPRPRNDRPRLVVDETAAPHNTPASPSSIVKTGSAPPPPQGHLIPHAPTHPRVAPRRNTGDALTTGGKSETSNRKLKDPGELPRTLRAPLGQQTLPYRQKRNDSGDKPRTAGNQSSLTQSSYQSKANQPKAQMTNNILTTPSAVGQTIASLKTVGKSAAHRTAASRLLSRPQTSGNRLTTGRTSPTSSATSTTMHETTV